MKIMKKWWHPLESVVVINGEKTNSICVCKYTPTRTLTANVKPGVVGHAFNPSTGKQRQAAL